MTRHLFNLKEILGMQIKYLVTLEMCKQMKNIDYLSLQRDMTELKTVHLLPQRKILP